MQSHYSPHGLATLQAQRGRLRIRLPRSLFGGKQKHLYLGLNDTSRHRAIGDRKVDAINSDLINDCFDITLERYKPQGKRESHLLKIKGLEAPSVIGLYERYIECRKPEVSPNTYIQNYRHWLDRLNKDFIPPEATRVAEDSAFQLLQILEGRYTRDSCRRLFVQLNACCRWAIEKKLIAGSNPYGKVLKVLPKAKKKRRNPTFFTKEEIGQILAGFANNEYYSHYTNYVAFLFATGARPSEVVCLTWDDVDDRFIHFSKRLIVSERGKIIDEGLKSEDRRKFPLNTLTKTILAHQRDRSEPGKLIFPSPKGTYIHIQNFSRRGWKRILEGLEWQYKRPYASRASFITHTLEHLDPKDVGRICGNNPETIYRHYAGSNIASLQVPDAF